MDHVLVNMINFYSDKTRSPLQEAVLRRQVELVADLLHVQRVEVDARDDEGNTPLHDAVLTDQETIVKLLLDAGADVNSKGIGDFSPLHRAARTSNINIIKLLVDAGAKVDAEGSGGKTPLHEAAQECVFLQMSRILQNALRENPTPDDFSHLAGHNNAVVFAEKTVELLIDAGADVNAKDSEGNTPLHKVAKILNFSNLNILKLMVNAGARVNERNYDGETFFSLLGDNTRITSKPRQILSAQSVQAGYIELTSDEESFLKDIIRYYIIECTDPNLTDKLEKNILAQYIESRSPLLEATEHKFFDDIIVEYVAVLKALKFQIDSSLLDVISRLPCCKKYYEECSEELQKAKSIKLHDSWVTFFHMLVGPESRFVKYAGNQKLVNDFEQTDVGEKFPIYGYRMLNNMSAGTIGRKLFNGATNILSCCLPIFDTTHLIIKNILEALSEEDWNALCK